MQYCPQSTHRQLPLPRGKGCTNLRRISANLHRCNARNYARFTLQCATATPVWIMTVGHRPFADQDSLIADQNRSARTPCPSKVERAICARAIDHYCHAHTLYLATRARGATILSYTHTWPGVSLRKMATKRSSASSASSLPKQRKRQVVIPRNIQSLANGQRKIIPNALLATM